MLAPWMRAPAIFAARVLRCAGPNFTACLRPRRLRGHAAKRDIPNLAIPGAISAIVDEPGSSGGRACRAHRRFARAPKASCWGVENNALPKVQRGQSEGEEVLR